MPLDAVIFDMDDTLVATAALWRAAETSLLQSLGHPWSAELAQTYKGMNALDVAATIHRALAPRMAAPVSVRECQRRMREALVANFHGPLAAMPGAGACVRRLAAIGPLAVASGSPPEAIELALTRLGLREWFAVVISSEAVPRGKPHPDVFLAAAAALSVAPGRCLVVEDSLIGVRAAKAAGMRCVVVPSASGGPAGPGRAAIAAIADWVFDSLETVTVDLFH